MDAERKEKKEEPIQVKMMAQELYEAADRTLVQKIAETLKKKTEPNQAPQTTIMAVTPAASHPSRQP